METHEPNLPPAGDLQRYHRQMLLEPIGAAGQRRLREASALIVGCGALGSVVAEQLTRAGVGMIRLVDRDIVELTNLQRQVLFDESDASEGLPKAVAAATRLRRISSDVRIEPVVADVDADNVEQLIEGVGLIIDGTDNVETRYLINDAAVKHRRPWVYGACVGMEGRVLVIRPPDTACLRCVFPDPPGAGELPTCDTVGVLGPVATVVGAMQAVAAIKLLSGNESAVGEMMHSLDLWAGRFATVSTAGAKRADCPACGEGRFDFLDRQPRHGLARLCGRNAVQIRLQRSTNGRTFDLDQLARRMASSAAVRRTEHLLRANVDGGIELTAFADGRVIVHGTGDPAQARSIVARYIGA